MIFETVKYSLEELRFIKSFKDIRIFFDYKLPYIRSKLFKKPLFDLNFPITLQIEPTNLCNLNCICCSRNRMEREKGYMDISLFKKIINQASIIGVKRIHLYLHGEPLMHNKIIDMIRYIKEKGLAFTIATNGVLLNKKLMEDILTSGVNSGDYFTFSILGALKETHERIMKGINHEKVVENIHTFIKMREKFKINGPIIETIFYKMSENEREVKEFKNNWRNQVDHIRIIGRISEQFSQYKKGNNKIPLRKKTCRNLWERMTIYWDGRVTTCIADLDGKEIIGNLKENSIKEIWNGSRILEIKKLHKKKKFNELKLCGNCDW